MGRGVPASPPDRAAQDWVARTAPQDDSSGGQMTRMDEPEPDALTGEALTIAVNVRLALRDQQWHEVAPLADRVESYPPEVVVAVLAQMIANGQVEQDDTGDMPRCRLASRLR